MKGFRFYLEYPDPVSKREGTVKKPGNHSGNVLAVILREDGNEESFISKGEVMYECISALYFAPNSDVGGNNCSRGYLRSHCKRIPEKLAREIHPRLFQYLEYEPAESN